jgi:hypothetical protein
MTTHRQAHYTIGPRFFVDGDRTMFAYRVDSSNEIGPREATKEDREKHPAAWQAFEAGRLAKKEAKRS